MFKFVVLAALLALAYAAPTPGSASIYSTGYVSPYVGSVGTVAGYASPVATFGPYGAPVAYSAASPVVNYPSGVGYTGYGYGGVPLTYY